MNKKRIAKNTLFLYFRMMLTMLVSLYTSRVVLKILGIEDYGIYQAVGGIVGFLSFINSALSSGSSRFLTFELGSGNKEKLRQTFSTILIIHILLALLIVIVGETLGLWFLHHEMVIDPEKLPLSFTKNNGAFVTLKINGSLRGCIGRFISTEPLYEVVRATALSSAFEDSRFPPLSKEEFDNLGLNEKAFLVFEPGYEISSKVNHTMVVKLYAIIDFFVEVYYLPESNKIDEIKTVTFEEVMNNYSDSIDISDVFE